MFKRMISGRWASALLLAAGVLATANARADDKTLTLCWAAWDPSKALVDLSKDFTQKTGIQMKYQFVPWTNFADKMLNELNSRGKLCDLLIGDSQWIGIAATEGHYVKLNEFFAKNGIKMSDFLPATVEGYSTWPKGTPNYWALPAMGDAVAWSYRKDWFARPDLQKEFKAKHGRELAPPQTWSQLKDVAQFFQGREIDGKKVYGTAIYTERGSEGITMGAANALYSHGMEYENPKKRYDMNGFVNSAAAAEGLKAYKDLFDCCTPPGHSNAYMSEDLDAYKAGLVAMQMNFIAFFPGIAKDANVGGEKSGFFVMPRGKTAAAQLGGQGISVVSYSPKRELALEYIKWFAQASTQKRWWQLGGFSCHQAVVGEPGFSKSTRYAHVFQDSMKIVKDFWQEPSYAQLLTAMQKRLYAYVVSGQGSAQAALDGLVKDWSDVFREDGKIQ